MNVRSRRKVEPTSEADRFPHSKLFTAFLEPEEENEMAESDTINVPKSVSSLSSLALEFGETESQAKYAEADTLEPLILDMSDEVPNWLMTWSGLDQVTLASLTPTPGSELSWKSIRRTSNKPKVKDRGKPSITT